jgi:hypothetical protein
MLQPEPPLKEELPSGETVKSSRRKKLGHIAEVLLLATALIALVAVVVYSVRITTGVSRNIGTAAYSVRLQIVNGSGVTGAESRLTGTFNGYADSDLNITVVNAGIFDLQKIANSFVISRIPDERPARLLASKLGLNPSEVMYEPLEHNVRSITATLVLGDDYHRIRLQTIEPKENK